MQPLNISLLDLNVYTLFPSLILIVGAIAIIFLDLIKNLDRTIFVLLAGFFTLSSLFYVLNYNYHESGFFSLLIIDGLSIVASSLILFGGTVFLILNLANNFAKELDLGEYYSLFLFMLSGFLLMASSNNLALIFLGLEIGSLSLYTLIALHRRNKSLESAIKYFTLGAASSGLFGFGVMIFYALTGSVDILMIKEFILSTEEPNLLLIVVGFAFLLGAIGFKLSLVPFHAWAPDVYEGSNDALAGFISTVPKIAAFVLAIRFFEFLASMDDGIIYSILWILSVVTITFGNLLALVQDDVKRMLAYSSISHSGFVLAAIVMGTTVANVSLFIYWFLFLVTNFGAFGMLWLARTNNLQSTDRYDHPFEKFTGLVWKDPISAVVISIFMLSLAGIPPLALYWGKIFLVSEAINSGHIYLGLIMLLNSALAAYYYIKLIVYMFLKDGSNEPQKQDRSTFMRFVLAATAIGVIVLFFTSDALLSKIVPLLGRGGF